MNNKHATFQTDEIKYQALVVTLDLITKVSNLYTMLPSFYELFQPINVILNTVVPTLEADWSGPAVKKAAALNKSLTVRLGAVLKTRKPLGGTSKPFMIKQLEPVFLENYTPGRGTDPIKERTELKKLTKKLKREKKGAERELRKDALFLASERQKEKAIAMSYQKAKYKKSSAELHTESMDTNIQGRVSKKRKRPKNSF